MTTTFFNVINFNAYRSRNVAKVVSFSNFLDQYNPSLVGIQEIYIETALKVFSSKYQVLVNLELGTKDGIGIVTLVKHGLKISDSIIGKNGRIIGVKVSNIQVWNIYPKSGSGFKQERERFFREELCNLMCIWKDNTKYVLQMGDHNCTHRLEDSLHNSSQHLQAGLVKHIQVHGLSDDFLNVHGKDTIMYSRVTNTSKTRIDYIFSNTKACSYFQYIDMNLGLDHRAAFARYDIPIFSKKEFIPKERYFPGWVISKQLEKDDLFCKEAKEMFQIINEESKMSSENLDPSFYWLKSKITVTKLAKDRERQIYKDENEKFEVLKGFYFSIISDIQKGKDCYVELEDIKKLLDDFYKERSKRKVEIMRGLEIDDLTYDIHKLQKQKKFENQTKIKEIKIGDITYVGTKYVVQAIEDKMKSEVCPYNDLDFNAAPTSQEERFLSKLEKMKLTEDEKLIFYGQQMMVRFLKF